MNNVEIARSMIKEASRRVQTAKREQRTGGRGYAIRSAQECAELSLKAALRFVGIEYPKKHDVSDVLLAMKRRFPRWFEVEKLAENGRWLAERREPAMYGIEAEGVGPDELFTRQDVETAVRYAKETYESCKRLTNK